jgi:hypothetical protein
VSVVSNGGGIVVDGISAQGGYGVSGGLGGTVRIDANELEVGSVTFNYLDVRGGSALDGYGGTGGAGGTVLITADSGIAQAAQLAEVGPYAINASGGNGPGAGGTGGSVSLVTSGGGIDVGGAILAEGGSAWDANDYGATGGTGGSGGTILLKKTGGNLVLSGLFLSAAGGVGGAGGPALTDGGEAGDIEAGPGGAGGAGGSVSLAAAAGQVTLGADNTVWTHGGAGT